MMLKTILHIVEVTINKVLVWYNYNMQVNDVSDMDFQSLMLMV